MQSLPEESRQNLLRQIAFLHPYFFKAQHASASFSTDCRAPQRTTEHMQDICCGFIEALHEGIWVIDKNAFTTYVNPSMEKMLGYNKGEMLGKSLFVFMDDTAREKCTLLLASRESGISEEH